MSWMKTRFKSFKLFAYSAVALFRRSLADASEDLRSSARLGGNGLPEIAVRSPVGEDDEIL